MQLAAGAVGMAQACLDVVSKYCNDRKQFGKPIGQYQMNQDMVAQMATEIDASRLLVYKAAWVKDQGQLNNSLDVAKAKYFAGETVNKCANYAMRILGAYGYSTEYPVARIYRDTPTYFMVEGSANVFDGLAKISGKWCVVIGFDNKVLAGAIYQNPKSICPQHQVLLPRSIKG